MLKTCLYIMLGGGIGASLRYITTLILNKLYHMRHWSTFCVNIVGCFVLGMVCCHLLSYDTILYKFIIIGIVGSYTTFSAFEYENIDLIANENYLEFLKYSIFSCVFAFLALACGLYVTAILTAL